MLTDEQLALKKRYLQLHSALLRHNLAEQVTQTLSPVASAQQRLHAASSWARAHPMLLGGAALALMFWRPSSLNLLAQRGLWLWQTWQRVQALRGPR
jgi:hypothetical protein